MDSTDSATVAPLMDLKNIKTNTAQRIETDVLDPVVINDDFCRFTLINKGYLNHASRITLAIDTAVSSHLPLNVGIDALISRAVLKFSNRVVSEISDFGHLSKIMMMVRGNQFLRNREQFFSGKMINHEVIYGNTKATHLDGEYLSLDNGMAYDTRNASHELIKTRPELKLNNAPVFSILLSELFPFFDKLKTFPLFMCKDQINIELHFTPKVNRCCAVQTAGATDAFKIKTDAVKMIADYIFYNDELMAKDEAQMNAGNGTKWNYDDFRLSKYSVGQAEIQSGLKRNVGGAGLLVSKLYASLTKPQTVNNGTLLNDYNSVYGTTGATVDINIRYNNKPLFTTDKRNPSTIQHYLIESLGGLLNVNKTEYSDSGALFDDNKKYEEQVMKTQLAGNFFTQGFNLTNIERIDTNGIEYQYKVSAVPDENFVQRVFLQVQRYAVLKDGHLTCYYY